jgi:GNAT superfamily N-acetyltransferase
VSACIEQQAFDTEAFGLPFHRIKRFDLSRLGDELDGLIQRAPIIIDATVPVDQRECTYFLMERGFRKICTQFELHHDLSGSPTRAPGARISDRIDISEECLAAHAENFVYDRFSLDPLIDHEGCKQLYCRWIRNSLGGRKQVVHVGDDFCTFAESDQRVEIDLVSVRRGGHGIGSNLIAALVHHVRERGLPAISVVTECENEPAWRLYMKCGFQVAMFRSVLHYVNR